MKILKERGITLVALVITIIVLLILAGVTLSLVLGDNGVVTKADEAKTTSNQKEVEEQLKLKVQEYLTNNEGEFNRAGFLSTLTEFTNNGDNTVTKDGVTLSVGENGQVAIVNNKNYGTLTKSWDISENQDGSLTMNYYDDTKTAVVSGSGTMSSDIVLDAFNKHKDPITWETTWEYPAETLIIDDSVTSVIDFSGCSTLKNVTIGKSVTELGDFAFKNCTALTSIIIPKSVTSIGRQAFYQCGVTDVYYQGSQSEWGNISINGVGNEVLSHITIHYNS